MEKEKLEQIIEAMLFSAGRVVTEKELMVTLEISRDKIHEIISDMQRKYTFGEICLLF